MSLKRMRKKIGKIHLNSIYNSDGITGLDKIPNNSIDLLLTDPPYKISQQLNCKGKRLGSTAKLDFDFGEWDERDDGKFINWVDEALPKVKGWAIVFCAKQNIGDYWKFFEKHNFKAIDTLVWQKPDPLPLNGKTKFLNAWESAIIGKKNGAYFGGYCTHNIFKYQAPKGKNRIHPTQKPLGLIKELIELTTKRSGIVLDPFMGSGTTAIACTHLGRHFVGFEIDKKYCTTARKIVEKEAMLLKEQTKLRNYTLELPQH